MSTPVRLCALALLIALASSALPTNAHADARGRWEQMLRRQERLVDVEAGQLAALEARYHDSGLELDRAAQRSASMALRDAREDIKRYRSGVASGSYSIEMALESFEREIDAQLRRLRFALGKLRAGAAQASANPCGRRNPCNPCGRRNPCGSGGGNPCAPGSRAPVYENDPGRAILGGAAAPR